MKKLACNVLNQMVKIDSLHYLDQAWFVNTMRLSLNSALVLVILISQVYNLSFVDKKKG